ncbi:MAG: IPT/TIG domain-containing protein [Candidatus Methanoperedens sp.]|nr:IPT/TIG domain-containing protein [Candidatus Methanoperedens sp.]
MAKDNEIGNYYWILSLFAGLFLGAFLILIAVLTSSLPLPMALLIIIALAMMIPESYDIYLAYLNKDKDGNPTGIEGLGRVLMTFGLILVVGAAAFYITTISATSLGTLPTNFGSLGPQLISLNTTSNTTSQVEMDKIIDIVSKNNQAIIDTNKVFVDTIKTILTALVGGITTIIGFYFGTKAAECKASEKKEQPAKPVLNAVTPSEGKAGETVTLSGTNLGSSQNGSVVTFGKKNILESKEWSATSIKVEVPQGLAPGAIKVAVIVNGVTSNEVPFTVK